MGQIIYREYIVFRGSNISCSLACLRLKAALFITYFCESFKDFLCTMAKRMRKRWWKHEEKVLRRQPDSLEVPHLSTISAWDDDMKRWPTVQYAHIVNYLVFSEGVDGEEMENFKSIESYNYFHSGKVGAVYVATATADLLYLRTEVTPSQDVNNTKHQAWVLATTESVVETAGCSCPAGLGKTCSHAGSILWKVSVICIVELSFPEKK